MTAGGDRDEPPREVARVAARLVADGVVGIAVSYVDNSGIARVKAVPVARLEDALAHGSDVAGVRRVHVDDAITASPSSTGRSGTCVCPIWNGSWCSPPSRAGVAPVDRRTQEGEPHPGCQRTFARRMVQRAAAQGLRASMGSRRVGAGLGWWGRVRAATAGPGYGMDRLIEVSDYAASCSRRWPSLEVFDCMQCAPAS